MITAEIFKDRRDKYRLRIRARNGRILMDGGQGYSSKRNLLKMYERIKQDMLYGRVKIVEEGK